MWTRRRGAGLPLVLGHRGASARAPENSVEAFERARADGADGVELDVLQCATGEVVVFHDDDLRLRLPEFRKRFQALMSSDDVTTSRVEHDRLDEPEPSDAGSEPTCRLL